MFDCDGSQMTLSSWGYGRDEEAEDKARKDQCRLKELIRDIEEQ